MDEAFLKYACTNGSLEWVQFLVERSACIDEGKIKGTPLNTECALGKTEIAQYLIEKGVSVNAVITHADGSFDSSRLVRQY